MIRRYIWVYFWIWRYGDFLHEMRGRPTRVDAPLLTVDESFRTCCQWRTCSLYPIRADDAIKWYHYLSRFGRIRRRRARMHLPRCYMSPRFRHLQSCTKSCDYLPVRWGHVLSLSYKPTISSQTRAGRTRVTFPGVSVSATDRWSYGTPTADRKSTT